MPDLFELSPNSVVQVSVRGTKDTMKELTLDHSPNDVQAHDHARHTTQCLLASANEIEHVTAKAGDYKGPAAQDDVDLRLGSGVSNTRLGEDLVQVETVVARQLWNRKRLRG